MHFYSGKPMHFYSGVDNRAACANHPADSCLNVGSRNAGAVVIRNTRGLAIRFRQNALDCEKSASKELLPEARTRLLKTEEHYRRLADKIDAPGGKWDAVLRSYGITP